LTLSDALSVLAFIFVSCKIEGKTKALSRAFIKHSLIAESVLEEHVSDAVHLTLCINLSIIDIAVIDAFDSINPLDYLN
jgi:hypothetical protein